MCFRRLSFDISLSLLTLVSAATLVPDAAGAEKPGADAYRQRIKFQRGVCVVLGADDVEFLRQLAADNQLTLYAQATTSDEAEAARRAILPSGLLGRRIYIAEPAEGIGLANNLADAVVVRDDAVVKRDEVLRVLHPGGLGLWPGETIRKPRPPGADDWSHPYHGPDNNPQSRDATARGPMLTQFLSEPWYVPMPQVTVASGGRVFKAFGHIALKEREWPWLNSLVAINGYNGLVLWKRPLQPGFMVHRNTLIATPDVLYIADNRSCKVLDAATGEQRDEIIIAKNVDGGGSWKWMGLKDGVLYALLGPREQLDTVIRGGRDRPGWPWSGLGRAYAGKYDWGFGHTLLAMNPKTKKILWSHHSEQPIDSRATCLHGQRLYIYSHQNYLACLDAGSGKRIWKSTDERTLKAIGEHDRAEDPRKGFSSSAYMKANDKGVYFAGPQRKTLIAISADNGSLMWDYPHGNFQLVLRDDGLYAMGRTQTSKKFDYQSGEILEDLKCYRGNCTRATGAVDSIFTRGYRHTGTMQLNVAGVKAFRIPLMRPACQDGVLIADGQFYWGPWMCDCNHSLVGVVCLAPSTRPKRGVEHRLESADRRPASDAKADARDWTGYRSGPSRLANSSVAVPDGSELDWTTDPPGATEPTAPIAVGEMVYWSGRDGIVRAMHAASGELRWSSLTGGAVRFPPEYSQGRLFVGSGDGWVYCFDARGGDRLWRFRAAPAGRKILVHGELLSTWPVGSGVLVKDDTVYAAAGIASYDGTYVHALDAATGKPRWTNDSSGQLAGGERLSGVSVQGHLLLHDDRLYLAGGNVVSPAAYSLTDGKCLNQIENEWFEGPRDAAFPANPSGVMFRRSPRGRELFVVDGKVRVFDELLYSPTRYGESRYFGGHFLQSSAGDVVIRATNGKVARLSPRKTDDNQTVGLWQNESIQDPIALAQGENAVVVVGEAKREADAAAPPEHRVWALGLKDGKPLWSHPLPAAPVSWGLALNRHGRAIVALQDGRLLKLRAVTQLSEDSLRL